MLDIDRLHLSVEDGQVSCTQNDEINMPLCVIWQDPREIFCSASHTLRDGGAVFY